MVTSDHKLALERGFLEPGHCLLKFRETALICEIAGMDQDVALRKPGKTVVGVGDANKARPAES